MLVPAKEVGYVDTRIREKAGAVTVPEATRQPEVRRGVGIVWGLLRLAMGWTFLWAFLDKAFGLGFATGRNAETGAIVFFGDGQAWLNGGSPTSGVLGFALKGPFKGFYQTITGFEMTQAGPTVAAWVNWLYMLSMLLIGGALILGIGVRLASIGGVLWMAVFYTAVAIWPENNPFLDDHIVYAIVLIGLIVANAGIYLGLGKRWQQTELVKRYPILA